MSERGPARRAAVVLSPFDTGTNAAVPVGIASRSRRDARRRVRRRAGNGYACGSDSGAVTPRHSCAALPVCAGGRPRDWRQRQPGFFRIILPALALLPAARAAVLPFLPAKDLLFRAISSGGLANVTRPLSLSAVSPGERLAASPGRCPIFLPSTAGAGFECTARLFVR